MTEIFCSYCLCLVLSMINGGHCHKCQDNVTRGDIQRIVAVAIWVIYCALFGTVTFKWNAKENQIDYFIGGKK